VGFQLIFITHRWYNVPPDPSTLKNSTEVVQEYGATQPDSENSRPLDFETFVPDHDPSLAQPSQPAHETHGIPPATGYVSRDEAFNRMLGAMYWAGYWTAVYHVSLTSHQLACPIYIAHMSSRVMDMNRVTEKGSHMRHGRTATLRSKKKMRVRTARMRMRMRSY
jgi:hypothetical protein